MGNGIRRTGEEGMKETEMVPFDSMPALIRGSFLTKEQAEKLKEPFKDVVSVVRCKDCRHGIGDENAFICGLKQLTAGMDWYCADGVAKDINVPDKEGR